jgi:hypothetical protein
MSPSNRWAFIRLNSLSIAGKRAVHVQKTSEFVDAEGWEGVAIMGAPMEVQNPGFGVEIRTAVSIPVDDRVGIGCGRSASAGDA